MKGLFGFLLVFLFLTPGCSLLLPHFLDGTAIMDSGLAGIVVINEVSAENPAEADWVEFYNSSTRIVDLTGFYLGDSVDKADWELPAGSTIAANSYLVVVCDGTGEGGNADFKLQVGVDQVALVTPDKKAVIDNLPVIGVSSTGSYARIVTNGEVAWTVVANPTKGSANQ